jgi:AraC-like DNA-binding protein
MNILGQDAVPLHPHLTFRRRSQREVDRLVRERDNWLADIAPNSLFFPLFDSIPGVYFFAKDAKGRTMFASRQILERYHMKGESEMLGLTDFDLNPSRMASDYVTDDRRLLEGEVTQFERVELWFDRQGLPDWFFVKKLPILDRAGRPAGRMGILRRAAEHERDLPVFQVVANAVGIFRREYSSPLSVADVAQRCGQSLRQLQRHFKTTFGISPQDFLIKTRVLAAADLLERTSHSVAEVAQMAGFFDTGSFVKHFRLKVGSTPARYRYNLRSRGRK